MFIDMHCPACGAVLNVRSGASFVTCEYCNSRFALDVDGDGIPDIGDEIVDDRDDDEASSLSMTEYAKQQCEEFLDEYSERKGEFKATAKIVRGLGIPDNETIYLIHDDTIMRTGKNGFAITERGIYCRPMGEQASPCMTWSKFAKMPRPTLDGSYIVTKAKRIGYYTGNDPFKQEILVLFQRLHRHAQQNH